MQDHTVNVLFVCSMNQWRSPTAEKLYSKHQSVNVKSRGTSRKARRTVSSNDLRWADIVMVMEKKHWQQLVSRFPNETRHQQIQILNVPDEYQFMDPELVELLRHSIDAVLNL